MRIRSLRLSISFGSLLRISRSNQLQKHTDKWPRNVPTIHHIAALSFHRLPYVAKMSLFTGEMVGGLAAVVIEVVMVVVDVKILRHIETTDTGSAVAKAVTVEVNVKGGIGTGSAITVAVDVSVKALITVMVEINEVLLARVDGSLRYVSLAGVCTSLADISSCGATYILFCRDSWL